MEMSDLNGNPMSLVTELRNEAALFEEEKTVYRASELLELNCEKMPVLFDPVFPRSALIAVAGSSDTGKSIFQRLFAISIVTGRDFLGWKNRARHKSAIIVSTEDEKEAISFLIKKQNKTLDLIPGQLSGLRYIFDSDNITNILDDELTREPADAVIIDAYSDVFVGKDSKDSTQTRSTLKPYKELAKKHDCLFSFLHHTGKRTEDYTPSKNNFIGSQSFEAVMRLCIELRLDKDDPNLRHLCIVKGNYLPADFKRQSYVLKLDENLVLTETGDRVDFDELAKDSKTAKCKNNIDSFDESEHLDFLRIIASTPQTKNQLNTPLREKFTIGDKTARGFIDYYIEKEWIKDVSNGGYPQRFQFALDQLPF